MKRFYSSVEVVRYKQKFLVELDNRPVKSPGGRLLECPLEVFAQNLALEWRKQEEIIELATMPTMRFASFVTDNVISSPDESRAEILKYAHSDLLCYRAEEPAALVEKQISLWKPVLERFKTDEKIEMVTTSGIQYVDQYKCDMERFFALLSKLQGYQLGAIHSVTSMSGSALLAMALYKNWLTPNAVWDLCHIDEDFQIEQWGRDSEQQQRRQYRYMGFCAASGVLCP